MDRSSNSVSWTRVQSGVQTAAGIRYRLASRAAPTCTSAYARPPALLLLMSHIAWWFFRPGSTQPSSVRATAFSSMSNPFPSRQPSTSGSPILTLFSTRRMWSRAPSSLFALVDSQFQREDSSIFILSAPVWGCKRATATSETPSLSLPRTSQGHRGFVLWKTWGTSFQVPGAVGSDSSRLFLGGLHTDDYSRSPLTGLQACS